MDEKIEQLYGALVMADQVIDVLNEKKQRPSSFESLEFSFYAVEYSEEESAVLVTLRIDMQ